MRGPLPLLLSCCGSVLCVVLCANDEGDRLQFNLFAAALKEGIRIAVNRILVQKCGFGLKIAYERIICSFVACFFSSLAVFNKEALHQKPMPSGQHGREGKKLLEP